MLMETVDPGIRFTDNILEVSFDGTPEERAKKYILWTAEIHKRETKSNRRTKHNGKVVEIPQEKVVKAKEYVVKAIGSSNPIVLRRAEKLVKFWLSTHEAALESFRPIYERNSNDREFNDYMEEQSKMIAEYQNVLDVIKTKLI